jgi:hypothetical protein
MILALFPQVTHFVVFGHILDHCSIKIIPCWITLDLSDHIAHTLNCCLVWSRLITSSGSLSDYKPGHIKLFFGHIKTVVWSRHQHHCLITNQDTSNCCLVTSRLVWSRHQDHCLITNQDTSNCSLVTSRLLSDHVIRIIVWLQTRTHQTAVWSHQDCCLITSSGSLSDYKPGHIKLLFGHIKTVVWSRHQHHCLITNQDTSNCCLVTSRLLSDHVIRIIVWLITNQDTSNCCLVTSRLLIWALPGHIWPLSNHIRHLWVISSKYLSIHLHFRHWDITIHDRLYYVLIRLFREPLHMSWSEKGRRLLRKQNIVNWCFCSFALTSRILLFYSL